MSLNPEKTTESFADQEFAGKFFVPTPVPIRVQFGGALDVGRVRKNNEDHFAIIRRQRSQELMLSNLPANVFPPSTDTSYCFIVADGMGDGRPANGPVAWPCRRPGISPARPAAG